MNDDSAQFIIPFATVIKIGRSQAVKVLDFNESASLSKPQVVSGQNVGSVGKKVDMVQATAVPC
jgi:hypothetical protein